MNAALKEAPWISNGPCKVYQAIAAITGELAKVGIAKGRKNAQQNYAFRGIDDVYSALSGLLAQYRLCVIPRVLGRTVTEQTSKSGGMLFYAVVDVEYDLVSAEDGSKHTARTCGEAMDSGDKATNKAMSAAYKYFALQTFCIPTEGDNDADAQTHEVAAIAKITAEQRVELDKLLAEVGSDAKKLCAHLKIASLTDIHATEFQSVRKLVESKRRHA
jgi:predicted component of type VI protein secretion system